jgi:diadenylate cyclase
MMDLVYDLWKPVLEVVIIATIFYYVLKFMQGTRGIRILGGVLVVYTGAFVCLLLANQLQLYVVHYVLLVGLLPISLVAMIVIFQPELRRGLIRVGESPFLRALLKTELPTTEEILEAIVSMSKKKVGALIAIERDVGLGTYVEGGVRMNALVTKELLETIFHRGSPLHDGAVIIRASRIAAAGCLFPLTENPSVAKTMGTRHRAAVGVTEETDAACIVVSEETGSVSVALRGNMVKDLHEGTLRRILQEVYLHEDHAMKLDLTDLTGKT